ncbi:uncharacterized protein LOC127254309 [Andrographis paniculata]|uniref:uncharacterized protein LOC127254309 n=1 Tax=Andrographis paniculata TaxID=175694 RepID=UPI0021E8FBCD|nr:uncharacterized protein LOC127254309 [Andrographis paniculata]
MDAEQSQPPPAKSSFRGKPSRRKIRASGVRLRKESGPILAKWSTRPETPLLSWKFDERGTGKSEEEKVSGGANRRVGGRIKLTISARSLASGLWRLQSPEVESQRLGHQPVSGHFGGNVHCHNVDRVHRSSGKDLLVRNTRPVSDSKHGILEEFEPPYPPLKPVMEGATKWDPNGRKDSDEIKRIFGQSKLSDCRANATRVISTLEAELKQARTRIDHLEAERRSSKKKLEQFLHKLSEERAAWRSREHEKIRVIINDLKSELSREKKARQKVEIANSKLANELADAKSTTKRYAQEYQKERKARELVEEVCDELAKEIGDDEAEVEALKRESMKLREEVEDERRMLQMAEVWREERVQMKLVDAKVMLEEKYAQMNFIIENLEMFMESSGSIEKADSLRQAVAAVDMQDVRELKYEPPTSDDIFSVLEDMNLGESKDRELEPCDGSRIEACNSPISRSSRIHTVTPEVNKDRSHRDPDGYTESSELEEDASEWETVSHPEDQGSSYSPDGSDPSVSKRYQMKICGEEEKPIVDNNGEVNSKIRQLIKFPFPSKDGKNGRLSNGGIASPDHVSARGCLDVPEQWSPSDLGNPHITRGMKGCIEWPRSGQRNSLKARLLEARIESQKVQLRQVLKQKI